MALSMIGFMMTKDNPVLAASEAGMRTNLQNLLKDLAVAGAGILIYTKRRIVVHRKD